MVEKYWTMVIYVRMEIYKGIQKSVNHPSHVLNGINLEVIKGEILIILGASGAGKKLTSTYPGHT